MKNLIGEFVCGVNAKASAFLVIGILALIGLGCFGSGRSSGSAAPPPAYHGDWTGSDGSTLSIRGDGKGDYKSGNTSVDGGTVEIDEAKKELSLTFFGIGPTLKIDSPPTADEMRLGGVVYRRSGGFSTLTDADRSSTKKSSLKSDDADVEKSDAKGDVPPDSEVESLIKDSLADFTEGVEQEDFTTLHANASRDFQATYTAARVKNSFNAFIAQKDVVLPILNDVAGTSAEFSAPPRIRTEKGYKILVAEGEFPTSPNVTKFKNEYVWEKGVWKMLKIEVRL